MPANSRRRNAGNASSSESWRAGSVEVQQPELGYTYLAANGRRSKRPTIIRSLETAPASVIELVRRLYKEYFREPETREQKQKRNQDEAKVSKYLQGGPGDYLDAVLRVTTTMTDAEEAAMIKRARQHIPHEFAHKNLLHDALHADEETKEHQRLARIGDLVQNLLLSELIYEGTDLSSGTCIVTQKA